MAISDCCRVGSETLLFRDEFVGGLCFVSGEGPLLMTAIVWSVCLWWCVMRCKCEGVRVDNLAT